LTTASTIPVHQYWPKAVVAGVAGVVVGVGVCAAMGGNSQAMVASGCLVLLAAMLGLVPVIFSSLARADRFGLAVLACTMGQTLLAIGAAFVLTSMFDLPQRAVVMSAFAGVFLTMMLQAICATAVLNALPKSAFGSTSSPESTSSASKTISVDKTGA
jgi:hypothetical protein